MNKLDSIAAVKAGPWESYLNHLATSPERVDSLWMWTLCTFMIWILLWKFRERMITGLEALNLLWEGGEQVTYFTFWAFFPILFRIGFFKDSSTSQMMALYITGGIMIYQITGRYIFDFALALKGGLSRVPDAPEKGEVIKKTVESKTESIETK